MLPPLLFQYFTFTRRIYPRRSLTLLRRNPLTKLSIPHRYGLGIKLYLALVNLSICLIPLRP
jgi:hypothetical protein